jgi:hypothetical protein
MRWSEQLTLIALAEQDESTDANGFELPQEETRTTVYVNKKSVGCNEFYKANMAGISAEMKFDIRAADYTGQTIAEYPAFSGKRYRIYRTYESKNGELVELSLSDLPEPQTPQED